MIPRTYSPVMTSHPALREERVYEECVDRQLGRAAHEGREQNRHLAVTFTGKRARGHHRRHRTSKADQHGHNAPSRKSDPAQQLVHKEGYPGDISAVLQDGQEEEHGDDDRKEAKTLPTPSKIPSMMRPWMASLILAAVSA